MYDQLDDSFAQRFRSNHSGLHKRGHSDDLLEPWEKNTVQIEVKLENIDRKYKTFYKTPSKSKNQIPPMALTCRRDSDFPRQTHSQRRDKSTRVEERRGAISHLNFNGGLLGQPAVLEQKKFSNQFFMKRIRFTRQKQKEKGLKIKDWQLDIISNQVGLSALKRRVSINKDSLDIVQRKFPRTNSQNDEQQGHLPTGGLRERRKSKIITLGFQKISHLKGLTKQHSLNLGNQIFS